MTLAFCSTPLSSVAVAQGSPVWLYLPGKRLPDGRHPMLPARLIGRSANWPRHCHGV